MNTINRDHDPVDLEQQKADAIHASVDAVVAVLVSRYSSVSDEFIVNALSFSDIHEAIELIELEQGRFEG